MIVVMMMICFIVPLTHISQWRCSCVSIVNFEQINADWERLIYKYIQDTNDIAFHKILVINCNSISLLLSKFRLISDICQGI